MTFLLDPPDGLLGAAGPDPSLVTPGLLGFLVFACLGVATWLLLRSFTRRLGRIRIEPEREPGPTDDGPGSPDDPPRAPRPREGS